MPAVPQAGIPPAEVLAATNQNNSQKASSFRVPNFNLNFPIGSNSSKNFLIVLICCVLIILITAFFIGFDRIQKVPKNQKPQNFETIYAPFYNDLKKDSEILELGGQETNFFENLDAVIGDVSSDKRYELLTANFIILRDIYSTNHKLETREGAEKISKFISRNFAGNYSEDMDNFKIKCFDEACGEVVYPDEIQKIKEAINGNTAIDDSAKQNVLRDLEASAYSEGQNEKWSYYINALSALNKYNDESVVGIYNQLKNFISTTYPDRGIPPQIEK